MTKRSCAKPASSGRLVVVAENHTVIGGLGEAVAGLLMRSGVHPTFRQIALPDEFLDAGALPTLHDRYGISTAEVARQIKGWLCAKRASRHSSSSTEETSTFAASRRRTMAAA